MAYQKEIREFAKALKAQGLKVYPVIRSMDAAAGISPAIYTGAFELAKDALPVVGLLLGAWIQSRNGRKVRLKIGEVEAEAGTTGEIEELLKAAERTRERRERTRNGPQKKRARGHRKHR